MTPRPLVQGLSALLLINALFLLPVWWRSSGIGSVWLIPELLLLPLLIGPATKRPVLWFTAAFLAFMLLAMGGDALVYAVFERPLNLLLDPWLLRAGYHFLAGSLGSLIALAVALSAIALTLLLVLGLHRLLELAGQIRSMPIRSGLATIAIASIAMGLMAGPTGVNRPALLELAGTQLIQARTTLNKQASLVAEARSKALRAEPIAALAERDLIIVFVESYGMVAWERPDYREILEPAMDDALPALNAAGMTVMSSRLRSPIRGGQSWLAHATLLSGQHIDNDLSYHRVLESGQQFLTDDLAATGHTPLVVAPAIVRSWPESRAMGFVREFPASALAFGGPRAGWAGIPDQFTLRRYSHDIRPRQVGPVFGLLLLIGSHAPWTPGPPLLEDWSRLDQRNPWPDWTPLPHDRFAYLRDRKALQARYPRSLRTSLQAVLQWAARALPDRAVLLVLGDHQPAKLIAGPGQSKDVPVHLISADAVRLAEGESIPFRAGFDPGQVSSAAGLEDLRSWLRRRPD